MKEKEIVIPMDLSEVTLDRFQRLQEFMEDETDEAIISQAMVSILCDMTIGEIRGLNKDDYHYITTTLVTTLNKKVKWKQRFFIGEQEYGLIPKIDDMSFGEYIDLDSFVKDKHSLHKIMSVLYRPIKAESFNRYEIEEYDENVDHELMLQAPMDVVQGTLVFFYHLGNELLNHIPTFLQHQMSSNIQYKQTLESNGGGIQVCMESLKVNLESLKRALDLTYIKL
jgi:hypothetical protein